MIGSGGLLFTPTLKTQAGRAGLLVVSDLISAF